MEGKEKIALTFNDSKRFYLLMLILYVLMLLGCDKPELKQKGGKVETFLPFAPNYVLNYQNCYREIMRLDIKFSEKVLRQTIVESAHYKSPNCKNRNNITGMKGGDPTADNPEGYKIFDSWIDCLKNYKAWQQKRLTDDVTDYYQFLSDWGYHQSPNYEDKCEGVRLIIVKK